MKVGRFYIEKERVIEILQSTKDYIIANDNSFRYTGICFILSKLRDEIRIGTNDEIEAVLLYLERNRPNKRNKYKEFTNNLHWNKSGTGYWWNRMDFYPETRQIRIDYLTALINNIK